MADDLPADAQPASGRAGIDAIYRVLTRLLRRLCDQPLGDLTPQTRLDQIAGLDSLRLLEVVALLEETFEVSVDIDRLGTLVFLRDIAHLIAAGERAR